MLCIHEYPLIDAAAYTEGNDAGGAEGESKTRTAVALECRHWVVIVADIHCLHNQQIVVETHHCVDESDEHHEVGTERTLLGCCKEHEELAEHACKRRNSGE